MHPRTNPRTFGMSTNWSRATRAQLVQITEEIVPTTDRRRGMYFTDLVSMTVRTTVKGAAYITMFARTAKTPKNFDGEDDKNDTKIANPVMTVGYIMVLRVVCSSLFA